MFALFVIMCRVTPISAASHKGNIAIMQLLIDHGAAVNALNISGSTALIQVRIHTLYTILSPLIIPY